MADEAKLTKADKRTADTETMNIVIAGHVDHGKSTVVGRLLADTNTLPEGKLDRIKAFCRENSRPFEYAFLIDALKDEQAQGVTIDSARVFFKTPKRDYIIIDAPGHIEFLKNMVTGASRAEAALLVIDAQEGVQENSRRHGYMLSMLGISQIAVVVNKMDLVDYDRPTFDAIEVEYRAFLDSIGVKPACFIPVSGMAGDNVASLSERTPWYADQTVVQVLDQFAKEALPIDKPFRLPVQDVYKFTRFGDNRRIIAGTIATGTVSVGDELVFYPSGKRSRVKSIEGFNAEERTTAEAGYAAGLTLEEQLFIKRGEVAVKASEPKVRVSTRLRASLFWLGRTPMTKKKEYFLKVGTTKIPVRLDEIHKLIDASDLKAEVSKDRIDRHDVAEVTLSSSKAFGFDTVSDVPFTSRFVLVDEYEIAGGGIVTEALDDSQKWVRDKVILRNYKWERSILTNERRAERYNQKAALILVTGERDMGKKTIAKNLESRLFADGRIVYFLGIGNVLYGVDADIKSQPQANGQKEYREEHIRRLSEVAHILLDSGVILIVTAVELTQEDLEIVKTTVDPDQIEVVWVGDNVSTDIAYDLHIESAFHLEETVDMLKSRLQENGYIFKPW